MNVRLGTRLADTDNVSILGKHLPLWAGSLLWKAWDASAQKLAFSVPVSVWQTPLVCQNSSAISPFVVV